MKTYLVKTPKAIQRIFPERVWVYPKSSNAIYLTFDDGPIPIVTPWVLDELKKHDAKATFFCIGDNIRKYPEVFSRIHSDGHTVANHTFTHLNGWQTKISAYIEDVVKAQNTIAQLLPVKNHNTFFRPPYGRLSDKQSKALQKLGYQIIMWDVISGDFDSRISEEKCLQNVLKNMQSGSVVVFHDSIKAEKRLKYTLPKVLEFISLKGWECKSI